MTAHLLCRIITRIRTTTKPPSAISFFENPVPFDATGVGVALSAVVGDKTGDPLATGIWVTDAVGDAAIVTVAVGVRVAVTVGVTVGVGVAVDKIRFGLIFVFGLS